MGGGGLRILPHKKWHVWRRDNIERVLRDEHEHEEQQQALEAKEQRLEQERRAQQLLSTETSVSKHHINFFQAEESQECNKHNKKKHKEGDDTLRRHRRLPWYAQTEDGAMKKPTARQERKRKRELDEADPLHHMRPQQRPLFAVDEDKGRRKRSFIAEEGPEGSDRRKYSGRYDRSSSPEKGDRRFSRDNKRSKRHKEKKSEAMLSKKESLMLELRRERDEREASERRRAERLI